MSFVSMSERVELERGNRKPSEIKELNLDNSKATEVEGLTDKYETLEQLSLVNIGLQSLNNLPKLPELRKIDLAENRLVGGLDSLLNCPKLEQINLSGNKIKSIEALTPLSKLLNLRTLDLSNCEIPESEIYRQDVFALIPHLKYLDGFDENNVEEPVGEELANGETRESAGNGAEEDADEDDDDDVDEDDVEDTSNDLSAQAGRRAPARRKVAACAASEELYDDAGDEDDEEADEDDDDDDEDDEDDEEVGLEALQNSKELEDDEEDYAPPEGDDDEEDDFDDDDEELDETGVVANLSAAGVTGPRRPGSKRRTSDGAGDYNNSGTIKGAPVSKLRRSVEFDSAPAEEVASNDDTTDE